jgi:hypothetical protein
VQKLIIIGSMGSALHIREIYSYRRCLPFFFLLLGSPTARTGKDTWTMMPHIDADFLKEVPFGSRDFQRKF